MNSTKNTLCEINSNYLYSHFVHQYGRHVRLLPLLLSNDLLVFQPAPPPPRRLVPTIKNNCLHKVPY